MLVLSHCDTRNLNGYMGWCGCHEILIALCYSEKKSFAQIKKISTRTKFPVWMRRETVNDDNNTWLEDTKNFSWWEKKCGARKCCSLLVRLCCSCRISLIFCQLPWNCLCSSISLFLSAKVEFDCSQFVAQNWIICPQNGNLLVRFE